MKLPFKMCLLGVVAVSGLSSPPAFSAVCPDIGEVPTVAAESAALEIWKNTTTHSGLHASVLECLDAGKEECTAAAPTIQWHVSASDARQHLTWRIGKFVSKFPLATLHIYSNANNKTAPYSLAYFPTGVAEPCDVGDGS